MGSSPAPWPGPHPRRGHGIPVFPWLSSLTPWQPGGGVSTLSLPSRALGPPHVGGCAAGLGRPGVPKIPPGALFILHTDPSWGPASASPDPSALWSRPCVVGRRGSQLPLLTVGVCVCASEPLASPIGGHSRRRSTVRLSQHAPGTFSPQPHFRVSPATDGFTPWSGRITAPLPGSADPPGPTVRPLHLVSHSAASFLESTRVEGGALSAPSLAAPPFFFTNAGSLQEACFVPDKLGVPEGAALEGLPASSPGSFYMPCLFPKPSWPWVSPHPLTSLF